MRAISLKGKGRNISQFAADYPPCNLRILHAMDNHPHAG